MTDTQSHPKGTEDEYSALARQIAKQDFNSCDLYCERPYFLIVEALDSHASLKAQADELTAALLAVKDTLERDDLSRAERITGALEGIDGALAINSQHSDGEAGR